MKKVLLILAVVCIGFASCQRNQSTASAVNKEEVSKAVGELFDEFNSAFKNKDANTIGSFLSDDASFLELIQKNFGVSKELLKRLAKWLRTLP